MFDPNAFLDMQVSESNDTKIIPVPVGEYTAVIGEVKCRPWQSKADPSKSGLALDLQCEIDDANVKALLGRDKITVKHGVMLDINDAGLLDMGKGKNVSLGRLREATDLNRAGQPFSFNMLTGRVIKVVVSHRIDGENIFAEVKAVAHA